jgi:hypothetical protein
MPGDLKFARQHAVVLAGQYDKYSLKVEQELREKPTVMKSMKVMYPVTGGTTDFKIMVGDLLFQKKSYANVNKRSKKEVGSEQQPCLLSSLNGLMMNKFVFERIPKIDEVERFKRAVKELIRFVGVAATPYTNDGTSMEQVMAIAVQVGGVVPGFNNSGETFEPGDHIMWDVPYHTEKMRSQALSEGPRTSQMRLKTVPRKSVTGIRPELLMRWVEHHQVPLGTDVDEFVRKLREVTEGDSLTSTAGIFMSMELRAEKKAAGDPFFAFFTFYARMIHRLMTLKRDSAARPETYQTGYFAASTGFAGVKEADLALNGQVFGKAFNAAGPGDKMGFHLNM